MKLDSDEQLIKIFRKHGFIAVLEILLFIFVAILPIVVMSIGTKNIQLELLPTIKSTLEVLAIAWVLFLWIGFFIVITDYYLDVWVLTNGKLVDEEQIGLFRREVAVIRIENIEDVTTDVRGIFATILNYGDVHIQSAGAEKEFIIRNVKNPKLVRDLVMKIQEQKANEVQRVEVV